MRTDAERFEIVSMEASVLEESLATAVQVGLADDPKHLPCRFFYDAEGSRLFEQICGLPEYYPTRDEYEILERRADEILALSPSPCSLVELGSGSAEKTEILIAAYLRSGPSMRFLPLDISRTALEESAERLLARFPELSIVAIEAEYGWGLKRLDRLTNGDRLVCCLGSNIGNFDRQRAAEFLRRVRDHVRGADRLLLGVDLRKDKRVLEAAYDDSQGVTAAFNMNLLVRINRELDADFDLEAFEHGARYDETAGVVAMHLVSRRAQVVRIAALDQTFTFEEGETIHTESSYKYSREDIEELALAAGFVREETWLNEHKRYSLNLLRPA